jgi:hypothetical protein
MDTTLVQIAQLSCSMCVLVSHTRTCPSGTRISLVFAKTFPSLLLETRLIFRTKRSRPSRSLFTESRTCSTMIFLQSQTFSLKSPSYGCSANLSIIPISLLSRHQSFNRLRSPSIRIRFKTWTKRTRKLLTLIFLRMKKISDLYSHPEECLSPLTDLLIKFCQPF